MDPIGKDSDTVGRGSVFDVRRFSIHDGPGIRTTVFLKGCPLACAWCHNPESQRREPELVFWSERCTACGACVSTCRTGAIVQASPAQRPETDCTLCSACGACVAVCVTRARTVVGSMRKVGELLSEIDRDGLFYEQSRGGVTLSGGEPLAQPEFAAELLQACHERRIHTVVDTCGLGAEDALDVVAEHVDLFLYDVKLLDDERHRRWTGSSNAGILRNLERLSRGGWRLRIRYPLIPTVNDTREDLSELSRLVARLPGVEAVDILPYHGAAERKSARLGRPYALAGLRPPDAEAAEAAADLVRAGAGCLVTIGG